MMRYFLAILLVFAAWRPSFSQEKVNKTIYSQYLRDSINCTIWLPEGWSANGAYTAIYTFSYGSSDAEFIAGQIHYLRGLNISDLPPVIVVNIQADMNVMGYNYETGLLTPKGAKTADCIKNEIIPLVEAKYGASRFRTYIGQSYGASYGNYLFLYEPALFSAYILMSPERIAPLQPPFEITPALLKFYSTRKTYYFLASGALDLTRRQDYAMEISEKLKSLDSSKFSCRYFNLSVAGHNNSLAVGLPVALDHVYQDYSAFPGHDSAQTVLSWIKQYENRLMSIYGIGIEKSSVNVQNHLLPFIWDKKDTTGMMDAISYFITGTSDVQQVRNFAYSCSVIGLRKEAMALYEAAIKRGHAAEKGDDFRPGPIITAYRELAFLTEKPEDGWDLLQKAVKVCLQYKNNIYNGYYPEIYYYLGKFSADNNYKAQEGLKYLQLYERESVDVIDMNRFNPGDVYYYIGKCYVLLEDKKNAKLYLQKSLAINSKNSKANDLLKRLDL